MRRGQTSSVCLYLSDSLTHALERLGKPSPARITQLNVASVEGALEVLELVEYLFFFQSFLHPDVVVHACELFIHGKRHVLSFQITFLILLKKLEQDLLLLLCILV